MAKNPTRKISKRLDTGKILFDHDFESAVLGAILLEGECFRIIAEMFRPVIFDNPPNRIIAEAIVALFQKGKPIDILTVTQEVKEVGLLEIVGGAYYISCTTNNIAGATNIEFHYRILQQYYLEREMLRIGDQYKNKIFTYGSDVFETYDWVRTEMDSLFDSVSGKKVETIAGAFRKVIEEAKSIQETGIRPGVPTGLTMYDRATGGGQKGDLIIWAARPAMGKTAHMVTTAYNAAIQRGIPVAIFSLEMSTLQLVKRLISLHTEIPADKFNKGTLTEEEIKFIESQEEFFMKAGIYIDDTPAISLFELRAKAHRLKADHNIQQIYVDYLQLARSGLNLMNREQEISTISRGLKALAKELGIPINALSQLSRAVDNRPGGSKRPVLSDLRESGAIEQDADVVVFHYRPDYYGFETEEIRGIQVDARGLGIDIIAKNRHGDIGDIPLTFRGEIMKFEDFDMSKVGVTITKQDVTEHLKRNGYLDDNNKSGTFVQQSPQDVKQESLTNNEDFLNQKQDGTE